MSAAGYGAIDTSECSAVGAIQLATQKTPSSSSSSVVLDIGHTAKRVDEFFEWSLGDRRFFELPDEDDHYLACPVDSGRWIHIVDDPYMTLCCQNVVCRQCIESFRSSLSNCCSICERFCEGGMRGVDLPSQAIPPWHDKPVPSHGGNLKVPPECWGMTLEQFIQVVHAFKMSGTWVDLRETHNQFKAAGHVNAYDMSTGFVVPLTTGTGCSVSLLMNEKPLSAEVMISHAWAEDMDQVMHMFLKMLHEGALPKEKVLWFCVLANYQPEDGAGPSLDWQLQQDPFGKTIEAVKVCGGKMIVLQTDTEDVYKRLWCCFEMDKALLELNRENIVVLFSRRRTRDMWKQTRQLGVKYHVWWCYFFFSSIALAIAFAILLPKTNFELLVQLLLPSNMMFWPLWGCYIMRNKAKAIENLRVETIKAICSREDDTKMIQGKILDQEGGFDRLDQAIFNFRQHSLADQLDLSSNETVLGFAQWLFLPCFICFCAPVLVMFFIPGLGSVAIICFVVGCILLGFCVAVVCLIYPCLIADDRISDNWMIEASESNVLNKGLVQSQCRHSDSAMVKVDLKLKSEILFVDTQFKVYRGEPNPFAICTK